MTYKCKKCGKKFDSYHALGGHSAKGHRQMSDAVKKRISLSSQRYTGKAKKGEARQLKVQSNGQPDMETMREHGRKYLEVEREILLRQVDQLDAALKLMQS